jgi:5-methylcytosine-specific restriction endonuclease McrBC regulatory subunit McrC
MARKPLTSAGRAHSRTSRRASIGPPLNTFRPTREICLELHDHSRITASAVEFFGSKGSDPQAQAARLSDQFIKQNTSTFRLMNLTVQRDYDGNDVLLNIESRSSVGAVPLLSPLTARYDLGLVVQPRFAWIGIGPMLAEMGWLISPSPLRLPLLRRSERRVPPWVLSFMVLARIKALLDRLERRFETTTETRSAPKGRIEWTEYATRQIARGNFLSVPCSFPDLCADSNLKGAIRFAIEKQLRSIQTQVEQGNFVHRLIELAETLLARVRDVSSRHPTYGEVQTWLRQPLRSEIFADGLQAVEWTIEDRGLAGASDLAGIPWTMPMEQFFEAWVETIIRKAVKSTGGVVKVGRRKETVSPLAWEPSYVGSQRSLVPDIILELDGMSVIFDAKYKRHFEELQEGGWRGQSDELREQHRADLLQVLAYANLVNASEVICCIVYPCSTHTWESLLARGRLFHRAFLPYKGRQVRVWLTAVPMNGLTEIVAAAFSEQIREIRRLSESR